jgi:hypothetical protein
MQKKVYQLKIALSGSDPEIWRRILVDHNISLLELHKIIQVVMGWYNAHLHQFIIGDIYYAPKEFDVENTVDSRKVKLGNTIGMEGEKFWYEYDFGDSWQHEILLEKIVMADDETVTPHCLEGERNCPPEDCGGIWGYQDLLKVLSDPSHEEHESSIAWLGGPFDPELFDIDDLNRKLQRKGYGQIWHF